MSDNLAPKFAQLSVRSEKVEDDSSTFTRANGEEEKGKNNPWKLIPSAENNALEADAWPAPSVPTEQRRPSGARQPDEKPKKKIKWQNCEVSNAPFAIRGRGSYATSFSSPHYNFRRGGPGFRGRGADTIRPRGANGNYVRNPFRAPGLRNPGDSREDKFCSSTATVDPETIEPHVDANRQRNLSAEQNTDEHLKSGAGDDSSACSVPSTNIGLQPSSTDSGPVRTVVTQSSQPKRPYRERMSVTQGVSAQSSATGAYEAGPVGRARRCYMRQHQTAYGPESEAASATHSLVTAAIQPLAQYQPVAPITYYIPGAPAVGTALWGPNLQLAVSTGSPSAVQTNVVPISVTNPALIPVPNPQPIGPVDGIDGSHSILSDLSLTSSTLMQQTLPRVPADLPSFKGLNVSEVQVEVVDVDKLIAFINERKWQNVIFPLSLKEHPAVAASIRAALGKSETSDTGETGFFHTEGNHSGKMSQEETNEKPGKPDVIIVEGRFFFVPRNVNRTKFLKFVSKSDYIRHHVEYYFSQSNLNRDTHLAAILSANQDVCPITELLQFNRLRFVSTTKTELLEAVASSPSVVVTYAADGSPFGIARIIETTLIAPPTTLTDASVATSSSEQLPTISTALCDSTTNSGSTTIAAPSPGQILSNGDVPTVRQHHLPSTAASQATSISAVQLPSLVATPNQISAQYVQSQAFLLNSVPRMEFNNASPGSVGYPGFSASQLQQYYPQSDAGVSLPQATSIAFPNQQNLYPQALVAAAANQSSLLSSNQPNLQSPDGGAAFMTAFYRITTPGHPPPAVGAFLPPVGNTTALAGPNNSPVFLQLLPTAHPSPGYLGSNASNPGSFFNRPVWIPVATPGSGIAVSNITPTSPFPHYITVSHGPPNLAVPNAVAAPFSGTVPHSLQAGSLPALPTALFDALYVSQSDQSSSNLAQSHITRQAIHSGSHSHTSTMNNTSSIQPATTSVSSSNTHPGSSISGVTSTHHALSFAPDSMTLSVSSASSNQPTPKKITINAHP